MELLRRYGLWVAIGLLAIAAFTGLVAERYAVPITFFLLGIALLLVLYWETIRHFDMWALDEWVRTRSRAAGIRDWHSPYYAAEHYGEPEIVAVRNAAAAEMNAIMMELIKNPADGRLRHAAYEAAKARHDQASAALERDIHALLAAGTLIAKGLPIEHDVARAERIIPLAHWRVMRLDLGKAEAAGAGRHYSGILVGRVRTGKADQTGADHAGTDGAHADAAAGQADADRSHSRKSA